MSRPRTILLLVCLAVTVSRYTTEDVLPTEYLSNHRARLEEDLLDLLSIPSISSLSEHQPDVVRAAEWLKDRLSEAGLEHTQVLNTTGPHPVVYADHLHAGPDAPTVLVYAHYDVQPADPLHLWHTPPFKPLISGGYFHGRGTDDDKGGLMMALHGIEAILRTQGALPVNVKILFEGEEEIGSPHLAAFLTSHSDLLRSDLALSADGGQINDHDLSIFTGFRGAMAVEVVVVTADSDAHSGMYGGSIQNAVHALVALLQGLRHANGSVAVAGFYDGVREPSEEELLDIERYPFDEGEDCRRLGVLGHLGEEGYSTLARRWLRPTLEVVGISGGFAGEGIKTIVPARAAAKVSCRLVQGQQPDDVTAKLQRHLQAHAPPMARVQVSSMGLKAQPWSAAKDTFGNAKAAAVFQRMSGGKQPLYIKYGATIPALELFQRILKVDTTVFDFGLGEYVHAPNERLAVRQFEFGQRAWVEMLYELGGRRAPGSGGGAAAAAAAGPAGGGAKEEL